MFRSYFLLHYARSTQTDVSIIFQSTPQQSFIGSHERSNFVTILQESKRWHCPDTQNVLDRWNLVNIYFQEHNVCVLSSECFKNGRNLSTGRAPTIALFFMYVCKYVCQKRIPNKISIASYSDFMVRGIFYFSYVPFGKAINDNQFVSSRLYSVVILLLCGAMNDLPRSCGSSRFRCRHCLSFLFFVFLLFKKKKNYE